MTVLESRFEQVAEAIEAGEVLHYEYDLKFDIVLKEAGQTVHGKPLLDNTIHILKQASRVHELIEFFDINGTQFDPEQLHGSDAKLRDMFCVEMGGPESKIFMFGLKIQTTIAYSNLKDRIQPALLANKTYMKIHYGGFEHGVNWNQLGYFIGKHPGFVDKHMLTQSVLEKFASGWKNDTDYWTKAKKQELQEKLQTGLSKFDPMSVPIVVTSNFTSTKIKEKEIRTQTATIMIPFKFYRAGITIMDYLLLHAKTIPNFIPHALKREDPTAYATILNAHASWMAEHRNIQITNIPTRYDLHQTTSKHGITLQTIISKQPLILDSNYDRNRQRLNISVNEKNFSTVLLAIGNSLTRHDFDFQPQLKQVNIRNKTDAMSLSTKSSKYTTALSSIISSADKQILNDQASGNTAKSPWKRRAIPSVINFADPDPNAFPPLHIRTPTAPAQGDSNSDTYETVATNTTTISMSIFQDALAQSEANHKRELEQLKEVFQSELALLKHQLSIHQTSSAQTTTNSSVEAKLDLIMQHLQLKLDSTNNTTSTLSPPRKRRDQSSTPTKINYHTTDDETNPEPALNWDSDEAEEDLPSSRDDAMALSGSED
jgi:hypothetical protein